MLYDKGRGVSQSERQAFEWYSKAAQHQDSDAQYNLGLMYLHGQGTAQNTSMAKKWLQQAAAQGDQEAKAALKNLK